MPLVSLFLLPNYNIELRVISKEGLNLLTFFRFGAHCYKWYVLCYSRSFIYPGHAENMIIFSL